MISPSGTPEKGEKVPENKPTALMKRVGGKAMDCRRQFQTGIKSPFPRREGGAAALWKPKVGDRKIILK